MKQGPGKGWRIFLKILATVFLTIIVTTGGILFLMRDRDMGTGLLEKMIVRIAGNAGFDARVREISGNPFKGYLFSDLSIRSDDILDINLETLKVDLSFKGLFKGKPLERILVRNGTISIPDPARLSKPVGEEKEEEKKIPYLPVEIENLALSSMGKKAVISSSRMAVSGELLDLQLSGSVQDIPLSADLMMTLSEGDGKISRGKVHFGEAGEIVLSGDLLPFLSLEGFISEVKLEELMQLVPGETPDTGGRIRLDFTGRGSLSDPVIQGTFAGSDIHVSGIHTRDMNAEWGFQDGQFTLSPLVIELLGSSLEVDLFLDMEKNIRIALEGNDLDLAGTGDLLGKDMDTAGLIETLRGEFSGTLPEVSGDLALEAGNISLWGEDLRDLDFKGSIDMKKIRFSSSLKFLGSLFQGEGEIELADEKKLDLRVSLKEADLDRLAARNPVLASLEPSGKISFSGQVTGTVTEPLVQASVLSSELGIMKEKLTDIRGLVTYRKDRLDIREMQLGLLGGNVTCTGEIRDLLTGPVIDVLARAEGLDLERSSGVLGESFPASKGITDLDIHITGDLSRPVMKGNMRTRDLAVKEIFSAEEIEGDILYEKGSFQAELNSPLALLNGMVTEDLSTRMTWVPGKLTLEKADLSLLGGNFTSSGNILMGKDLVMDLKGNFDELAIEKLPYKIPLSLSAQTYGAFSLKGKPADPSYTFIIMTPAVAGKFFTVESIRLEGFGDLDRITLKEGNAFLGQGTLQATGTIRLPPGELIANFSISGKDLDLRYLSPKTRNRRAILQGLISLDGILDITGSSNLDARFSISSDELSMAGLRIKDLGIPVVMSRQKLEIPSMNALLYGGTMNGSFSMSLPGQEWSTSLKVESMDLGAAVSDLDTFPGSISGTVLASAKVRGKGAERFNLFGNGDVTVNDGEIRDIPAIKAAAATAGRDSLKYRKIRSNFLIDGFGISLLAGTRMQAPLKDPLYRYANIDGTIQYDGELDLHGNTEVNLRAFNAFMGGLKIALQAAMSPEALTKDILGGLTGRLRKQDFREVTFHLAGTREEPELKELKVTGGEEYISDIINLDDFSEEKREEPQIQIKLNFPVGPGGSENGSTAGEDLKQQLLEGIFKSISGPD
ncbi:MAG: hypothetical protein JW971_09060 [Synergistales bacterium]|nr:hypothetical protein [Synergistales bacterium]